MNCPMTESGTRRLVSLPSIAVLAAALLAGAGAAQESPDAEDEAAPAEQSPPQGEPPADAVEPGANPWDLPTFEPEKMDRADPSQLYLGPIPRQPAAEETGPPADRPPTSILVGPYIPEGSIRLPDLAADEGDDAADDAAEEDVPPDQGAEAADAALAADIAVDPLTRLDPGAVGAWELGEGEPFPVDMWQGSTRGILNSLIPQLPMTVQSPVMRELARRLLLSPARLPGEGGVATEPSAGPASARVAEDAAPGDLTSEPAGRGVENGGSGDPPAIGQAPPEATQAPELAGDAAANAADTPPGEAQGHLLAMRLERLAAAGALDDLLSLAERVPDSAMTGRLQRLRSDALLVLGDYDAACMTADEAIADSGAAYWLQVLAICEALQGNRSGTYFRLSLLEESGESSSAFSALVEALLSEIEGTSPSLPPDILGQAERLGPVLFSLSRLTQAAIPERLALTAEPLVLDALVELPDLSPEVHLAVAERAVGRGLLRGETLREIYAAISFTDDELAQAAEILADAKAAADAAGQSGEDSGQTAASDEESDEGDSSDDGDTADDEEESRPPVTGLRLDALVYQRAMRADRPAARLDWMGRLMERGRTEGRAFVVAEAMGGPVAALDPSTDLAAFAGIAGRILLLAGDIDGASAWYDAARRATDAGDPDAREALVELWPLLVVTDRSAAVPYSRRMLQLWWQGRGRLEEAERLARGDRLFSLLGELGHEVPDELRHAVLAAPPARMATPPSLLWRQLILAAMDERLGESVLTALAAVGEAGPQRASPALLTTAVGALQAAGLEREARRFAMEALVAGGF